MMMSPADFFVGDRCGNLYARRRGQVSALAASKRTNGTNAGGLAQDPRLTYSDELLLCNMNGAIGADTW